MKNNSMFELTNIVEESILSNLHLNGLYIEVNLDRINKENGIIDNAKNWGDDILFGLSEDGHNYEMILRSFLLMLMHDEIELVKTDRFDEKRMKYIKDLHSSVKNKYD